MNIFQTFLKKSTCKNLTWTGLDQTGIKSGYLTQCRTLLSIHRTIQQMQMHTADNDEFFSITNTK